MFHPRIVPLPNATITELGITELFYYDLLLPIVAHSIQKNLVCVQFHHSSSLLHQKLVQPLKSGRYRPFLPTVYRPLAFSVISASEIT